jgi:organic hydroperoxide reductase OsmC/OhrA
MAREHRYTVTVEWTGNRGTGTSGYRDFGREHIVTAAGKPEIPGSSDPAFRGDPSRWNPEELLVVSLSQCHMLWYLHLAATAGIVVTEYRDAPSGIMVETPDGSGRFSSVVLKPQITVARGADLAKAEALHHTAHEKCFIANSVNFPVTCEPGFEVATGSGNG